MKITLETKRMIVKTNARLINRKIIFPDQPSHINILDIKPSIGENTGFMFYDKSDHRQLICHIALRDDRKPNEITYGTQETYRNKGYMQEALNAFIKWIFKNTDICKLYALISNNPTSEKVLINQGFIKENQNDNRHIWYCRKSAL